MQSDIPEHDVFISRCVLNGSTLTIRFVPDFHPLSVAEKVFCAEFKELQDALSVAESLQRLHADQEMVFIVETNEGFSIHSEHGLTISMRAGSVVFFKDAFNTEELEETLSHVYAQYLDESERHRATYGRVIAAQRLIHEQLRRLEVKTAGHAKESTAAILYSQQVGLLERLLTELGPS